ncbi:uncharacterized protein ARB_07415 [Trichophyton benhamiae CBS 112371]|uniref:Invertebrate defensins family profile domain-containing protein n=2 Tax=Trichophyton TaxID=5550 RepID=D4AT51_ARTBC|nr:uncharacterized protein ARB_07415 [Trichophyton benhamiae CBS 112371]XP_003023208.1 uncharacterized protein TRV_02671 [Trichophyton verrucosum HKI 0517]EFE33951.1 hypothetical protein ARB_07415 [Trichophyton benhamiae CBS 112371]EFE42590.1 hypothetical protein TRV_02671 [Trichophyton verrucosum HKI 0517]
MQFTKLATVLIVSLMGSAAIAAPPVDNAPAAAADEVAAENLGKRGFGCPLNERECHAHCLSIGRKFGYCGGSLRL